MLYTFCIVDTLGGYVQCFIQTGQPTLVWKELAIGLSLIFTSLLVNVLKVPKIEYLSKEKKLN